MAPVNFLPINLVSIGIEDPVIKGTGCVDGSPVKDHPVLLPVSQYKKGIFMEDDFCPLIQRRIFYCPVNLFMGAEFTRSTSCRDTQRK